MAKTLKYAYKTNTWRKLAPGLKWGRQAMVHISLSLCLAPPCAKERVGAPISDTWGADSCFLHNFFVITPFSSPFEATSSFLNPLSCHSLISSFPLHVFLLKHIQSSCLSYKTPIYHFSSFLLTGSS